MRVNNRLSATLKNSKPLWNNRLFGAIIDYP